ncbi:MAG: hypothetical protein KJ908_03145 [Acidobacteria bacterium]|nr:hypothetical protein [Acidobacteriota bacterium]MCG2817217.1 hypothetical protein [Candidatus Aminicenantes bacterium]MBU4203115.1 hypothetical protein [Acidobacteriota bacterium]MBU4253464.1 hypothetical protein [Acidobacteriota bacterium]MBU4330034.1 hypothetical protein [Acidobacteriota bacterium]
MMITVMYYILAAAVAVLLMINFLRSKKWQDEILYLIVLLPFILRLLRLK